MTCDSNRNPASSISGPSSRAGVALMAATASDGSARCLFGVAASRTRDRRLGFQLSWSSIKYKRLRVLR